MLLPVIMAGGTGSRLWPMSRELYPKQFLRLFGQNSMLQETITRLSGLEIHEPMVICNEEHRFLVAEQLRQLNKLSNNIILEPVGRNTRGPSGHPSRRRPADAGPRRRPYHQ